MDSSGDWRARLAEALGTPSVLSCVSGGVWRAVAGQRSYAVKVGMGAGDEALGLAVLAGVEGGPRVPQLVLCHPDTGAGPPMLVTTWVDQAPRSHAHEEDLGRRLAILHNLAWSDWGGGSRWIGRCKVDNRTAPSAAQLYGRRLCDLAERCDLAEPVGRVVGHLAELLPPGAPALLHGDLWWGNVLWGADGHAWLIDPSVHGGHPEEDLAMLALFGAVPNRLLGAYAEVRALEEGWRERVELFQLYPLLVHAVLFGGGYRTQARAVAARYA